MAAELKLMRTAAEQASSSASRPRRRRCRATPASSACARRPSTSSPSAACRTGASRSGNTPTCARLMREAAPLAEQPAARMPRRRCRARGALRRARRPRISFVNGHLLADASDLGETPAGVEIVPLAEALAAGHPLAHEHQPGRRRPRQRRLRHQHRLHERRRRDPHRRRHARSSGRFICASSIAAPAPSRPRAACWSWSRRAPRVTLIEIARRPGRRSPISRTTSWRSSPRDSATVRHVRLNAEGRRRSRSRP